ncbi:G2/mitotic-specific cyclin [Rhizophlyctis rosea]|uniref:G2/mitotic-specific cyclin n=1 Tax=Rhizophlyctis rosea TaxID=64517 RepID=A0AAD5SI86_9FUNG|nr:G2/mitotic-specific cyclin [Rhizophlyctis rosea]
MNQVTQRTTRSQAARATGVDQENAQVQRQLKAKAGLTTKTTTAPAAGIAKKKSTTALGSRPALADRTTLGAKETKKGNVARAQGEDKPAKGTSKAAAPAPRVVKSKVKVEAKADEENAPPSENAPAPKTKVKGAIRPTRTIKAEPQVAAIVQHRPAKTVKNEELPGQPPMKKAKTYEPEDKPPAPTYDDLDEEDANDPLMVSEYVNEIFEYMKKLEVDTLPNPNYMDDQRELQWKMRTILIDWLIEVHNKFRLLPETLYLAVNIIDRFLSMRVVSLVKLQLVGVTAMFIAAKYEEICAPSIESFIYVAEGGYTDDEILKAERYVLQVLDFSLQYPSPLSFLRRCSKADNYDPETRTMAKYFMEISLVDQRFLSHTPSKVAAAGLLLARRLLRHTGWDANLTHYSGYTEKQLADTVRLMVTYLEAPCKFEALFKKYASRKFLKVSIFAREKAETGKMRQLAFPDGEGEDRGSEMEEDEEELL